MSGPRSRRPRWGKDAEKYLLPDEPPVIATRRHPAVLARPALRGVPAFAVGVWFLQLDPDSGFSTVLGLVVVLGSLLYLGLHVGEWWVRHFLITRRRVLMTSGVFIRTVAVMPLRRITDLTWKETGWGQVLGYGTFRFESAGQAQGLDEITYLPHANALYKRLSELMFGTDFSTNPVSSDEEADGSMNADDRGAEAAPEQHMPPPLQSGRRHDTAPIRRTRPPS
ncbi:PH domain-containing protein [Modestobacter sp. VKM Ac-2983]|uniref:PH domain-containing protein n=1 Tax=Modestobacter sp. VKM Ac-2983 TaxID=3004137 RepID=UPI0022AB514D|nr:PH domain-containing protein [Modestobacter sp. VKM Ac-2983]MCZ2806541.1 PH domain-containing protein [Modestobacter sp. VKM Ac-2983]